MKRSLILTILIVIALFSITQAVAAEKEKTLTAAPDVIPPATEEMQSPEFWISRLADPDRVVMTPDDIRSLNEKNRTRSLEVKDVNGSPISFARLNQRPYQGLQFYASDPLTIVSVPGDSLREGINTGARAIEKRTIYDRRWIPFTDALKREIVESMNMDSVSDVARPRYGIVCTHTHNRRVPSHLNAYTSQYDWLDYFQTGAYETGTPVAVLHQTKNGDWYYVRAPFSYRWIPAESVALGSPEDIGKLSDPGTFIVALPHKVPVYADPGFTVWIADFYQGARLTLMEKSRAGYRVLVPRRGGDGSLAAVTGWVKPDADVSEGYQPFTQRNVITTMFKLLDHPYGWGDGYHERDCCGIIRTVFNTFGIFTPRAPTHQFLFTDHTVLFPKDMPKEDKFRLFDPCEPGISICGFSGHIMMYLGKVDGSYFVIHSNGYSYHDEEGNEIRVARTSVTDLELEGGSDINSFTNIAVYKP